MGHLYDWSNDICLREKSSTPYLEPQLGSHRPPRSRKYRKRAARQRYLRRRRQRRIAVIIVFILIFFVIQKFCNARDEPDFSTAGNQVITVQPNQSENPPSPPPTSVPDIYEFGTPLEESETVSDEWFDHVVFLGDSRTEGLQLFSGLLHGDFFWDKGMSVFRADSSAYQIFNIAGRQVTLLGTLDGKRYGAIYLMLGINELGYQVADYEAALSALIDKIIYAQPDAVIYLQTLPPVNDAVAHQNGLESYINTENVRQFNDAIVRVAAEKRVVLLDTASIYQGKNGQLPAEMTYDGVHFDYDGYGMWADYLRCHIIDPERYFYNREL